MSFPVTRIQGKRRRMARRGAGTLGLQPLKRDLNLLTSGSRGWAEHYAEEGNLFLRIGNLTRDSTALDLSDIQRVLIPDGLGERTRVQPGDLLFSITAYLGSVAVVPLGIEAAYVSQHVASARLRQQSFFPSGSGWLRYHRSGRLISKLRGTVALRFSFPWTTWQIC